MTGTLRIGRRRALALLGSAALAGLLPACGWDGHFAILGYTTRPNYDCSIHTVRVPIFENRTYRQGLEFDLTQAVVREIEAKTPYKVVSHGNADTELKGKITSVVKNLLNVNQLNEVREAEMVMTVELIWKDLRTGKILTRPARRPGEPLPTEALADPALAHAPGGPLSTVPIGAPVLPSGPATVAIEDGQPQGPAIALPTPPTPDKPPPPMILTSRGNFIPELGQSTTSSMQLTVDRMAVQIINMMEKPW